jgi:hypothetical protein
VRNGIRYADVNPFGFLVSAILPCFIGNRCDAVDFAWDVIPAFAKRHLTGQAGYK